MASGTPFGAIDYNPSQVTLGPSGNGGSSPYLNIGGQGSGSGGNDSSISMPNPSLSTTVPAQPMPPILAPEAIRATGNGPFDPAYRQNLATFAGGQFFRPGGYLSFDPTGSLFGKPTGGGLQPLPGMPDSLLGMALSGNPFSYAQPQPAPSNDSQTPPDVNGDLQTWLQKLRDNGIGFGMNTQ